VIHERAVPVVLSVLIIVLVAVVQERSRYLAAVLATMTTPFAMWIVFSASEGDQRHTADFVGSMVLGSAASLVFILVCWFGQALGFLVTLVIASAIWLAVVLLPHWVGGWLR
jgi:hypothetical protein